jgi:nuclear pore complex protein Nup85
MEAARLNYTSWWELFGAWMLYVAPGSRRGDLGRVARDCASVRPLGTSIPKQTHLDNILLALMEDDLHQVLHDIQQLSDNCWMATHLTDLLVHCGKLKILDENLFKFVFIRFHRSNSFRWVFFSVTDQLRDSLVLDYGSLLGGHHSLWSVGFSYLAQATNNSSDPDFNGEGLHRISCLLSSQPLGSEHRVMKLLHETKKYNLPGVGNENVLLI